jgi:hypothetical protein
MKKMTEINEKNETKPKFMTVEENCSLERKYLRRRR